MTKKYTLKEYYGEEFKVLECAYCGSKKDLAQTPEEIICDECTSKFLVDEPGESEYERE